MSNENFPSPILLRLLGFDEIKFPNKNSQPAEATSGLWKLDKLALVSHDVHFDLMDCFFLSIHFIDYNLTEFYKITINYYSAITVFCYEYDVYPCNDQSGLRNYDLLRTVS